MKTKCDLKHLTLLQNETEIPNKSEYNDD